MNFDRILKVFVPKEYAFFPMFEEGGRVLVSGTESLIKLSTAGTADMMDQYITEIKKFEKEGDVVANRIFAQLNKSFITPFDREDIHTLATRIDDVLDNINTAAQRIKLYKPKKLPQEVAEVAKILLQLGSLINKAMPELRHADKHRESIYRICEEIHELEKKADHYYSLGISALFENEKDIAELIKLKDILASLEKAVNKAEDVADTLRTLLIKMA